MWRSPPHIILHTLAHEEQLDLPCTVELFLGDILREGKRPEGLSSLLLVTLPRFARDGVR